VNGKFKKLHPVATKPLFFEENCTLLQQNHGFQGKWYPVATKPLIFEENCTLLQQNQGFSRKMASCCNKTMNFQVQPSLTSPVPDLDPGHPKTLKTRVFHLNGNALSRPWTPKNVKNTRLASTAKAAERILFEL
jgi:hypothetical protein